MAIRQQEFLERTIYLILPRSGNKHTKNYPHYELLAPRVALNKPISLKATEIYVRLDLKIPLRLFIPPEMQATLELDDYSTDAIAPQVIQEIESELRSRTGVEIKITDLRAIQTLLAVDMEDDE